jgi:hypothetical protein
MKSTTVITLKTDTSKWATGAVLQQIGNDRQLHPCGYISHTFNTAEQKYLIYDHELFTVIRAFKT